MGPTDLFPFMAELSTEGRNQIADLPPTVASPRQRLIGRGDAASGAYLVLEGALRVFYVTDEGREATLYRVEVGDSCVLALSATLRTERYPAWVEAGPTGGTFLQVSVPLFNRAMESEPAFRRFVLDTLSARIFDLMHTIEEVMTSTVERRVAALLIRDADPQGDVHVTQEFLAADLGTAREVVFRALRSLSERGAVSTGRGRVRVLDPGLLTRIARLDHS